MRSQVVSGPTPLQPNGDKWTQLMLKSALFEVHNMRSLKDRAPDILPQVLPPIARTRENVELMHRLGGDAD